MVRQQREGGEEGGLKNEGNESDRIQSWFLSYSNGQNNAKKTKVKHEALFWSEPSPLVFSSSADFFSSCRYLLRFCFFYRC